jgi:hypothetical protein
MPILRPERPRFVNGAERQVWETLRDQLTAADALMAGLRISERRKDHEADLVVLMPGAGVAVLEVKGGAVRRDNYHWRQSRGGSEVTIDPVDQVLKTHYALRNYVESDPRWQEVGRRRVQWGHAVVVPHTTLPTDFASPDCPRWMIADSTDLPDLAGFLRSLLVGLVGNTRPMTDDDLQLIVDILGGRGQAQRDLVAAAQERELDAQRLTEEQAMILTATRQLNRVEVRGGAGSGKTWLAMEQARRLTRAGQRVALLCYSRGLAAYLKRHTDSMPAEDRPAYVGGFHGLGHLWGAEVGSDDDSDYWERRLPEQMRELAGALPADQRFDSVVIDEAQDFADAWWPAVLAALRDEETGGVYVFSDEGQRVFARYGQPPVSLLPLMLDHNLRNTRQIAATFNSLAPMLMKLSGADGPVVRFVECESADALAHGDDAVDALLEEGWRPEDIALLTTGSRHPEQTQRQADGQDAYWDSFWDTEQVFYGHVLGFKGLERRAVVLVLNETEVRERSRERLYVGLSRARDQLVVCGSSGRIRELGGEAVLRQVTGTAPPTPTPPPGRML